MDSKKKKRIFKIFNYFIFILVAFFALSILFSKFSMGGLRFLTVQSGSMEPAVKMGSLVVVKNQKEYKTDDIITFHSTSTTKETTTHRIVDIIDDDGVEKYQTQGDANGTPDGILIPRGRVVGKVTSNVPYLGYPIAFSRTLPGLVILVIIPAMIIIYEETGNIKKEIQKYLKQKKKNKPTTKSAEPSAKGDKNE